MGYLDDRINQLIEEQVREREALRQAEMATPQREGLGIQPPATPSPVPNIAPATPPIIPTTPPPAGIAGAVVPPRLAPETQTIYKFRMPDRTMAFADRPVEGGTLLERRVYPIERVHPMGEPFDIGRYRADLRRDETITALHSAIQRAVDQPANLPLRERLQNIAAANIATRALQTIYAQRAIPQQQQVAPLTFEQQLELVRAGRPPQARTFEEEIAARIRLAQAKPEVERREIDVAYMNALGRLLENRALFTPEELQQQLIKLDERYEAMGGTIPEPKTVKHRDVTSLTEFFRRNVRKQTEKQLYDSAIEKGWTIEEITRAWRAFRGVE